MSRKMVLLMCLILLLGIASNSPAALVGRWSFDDQSANDSSGNGHNGTLTGNAAIVNDATRGYVLSLDGAGDYVDLGNGSWTNPGNNMTVAAWIKVDVFDASYQCVIAKGNQTYRLSRNSSGNVMQAYFNYNSGSYKVATGSVNVNNAAWHHLATTYDGTTINLYVDGNLEDSKTCSTLYTSTANLCIGRNVDQTSRDWQGWIDDVRLYTNALTQTEIRGLAGWTYTISGSVGTLDGVTMSGLPGSPVTSGGGSYTATVEYGWSGTVTPSKTGYTFSPTNKTYSNVTSNQSAQDYTPTQLTYTVSGTVGTLDGVTMNGLPGSPVTSGGGNYTATVVYGWSGTATPSKAGYTFSPVNKTYSNVTANQAAQNYTPTQLTYTISGTVGTLVGVTMNGLPGNPQTTSGGAYTATVVYGWNGTVTPAMAGYTFSPVNKTYSNVTANQTSQNYTPTLLTYTISGTVGTLDGVTMGGLPGSPVTSGGGNYIATVNYGWTGTVTPAKTGYTFSPVNKTYSNVTANQSAQDFTPTLLTYVISGTVGTLDGVTMGGLPGSPVTSGGGTYSATVDYGWTGTVTPSKAGYIFSPTNKTYSNVTSNQSAQNFTPTLLTYVISGKVGTVNGVTMNGLPGNPVTSGGGNYSATVDYGWNGTVTPSYGVYGFNPAQKTYASVTSNISNEDYSPIPDVDLAGSWNFDDSTYNDNSGYGRNGTISGNATIVNDGTRGNVLSLDGNGDYVTITGYKGVTGTASRSIMAWIKANKDDSMVIGWGSNSAGQKWIFKIDPTTQILRLGVSSGYRNGTTTLTDNQWHHVAAVLSNDGTPNSDEIKIYVDGLEEVYSYTSSYAINTANSSDVVIGYFESSSYFGGLIDDVRIYSKALSLAEIQDIAFGNATFTVSGTTGSLDGVTMSGLPGNPVTSGGGAYSVTVTHNWAGTVTPSKAGYTFSPASKTYPNVTSNQVSQNYTPTLMTYTITGTISDVETMHEMDGVTMSGMPGSPVTDVNGFYTATVGYGWSGTATPTRAGFTFAPANKTYSNVTAGQSAQDYAATVIKYTISGYVGTLEGVLFENLPNSPATNENGFYTCQVEYGWSGTVIPDKDGYVFNPTNKTYSNVISAQSNQNYTPTSVNAENPSPENGAVDVFANQTLSWTSAAVANPVGGQNVYFGTSLDAVTSRDESVFIGNQSGTTYNPGTLTGLTTYYWAIDTVNDAYEESPWAGEVWSFTTINTELVGYWRLNEGTGTIATDTSGYGNNGTITDAAWLNDGVMGNVLDFEGVDYVTIPSAAFSSISSQITIALWQYGDAALQPQNNSIFEGTKNGTNRVLNAHVPWGSGVIYFDAGYTTAYDRISKAADSANQYEGQWNHWAFTKNTTTGQMKIYYNGELWHSGTGMTRSMSGITAFKIGSIADGTSNYDGMICEFRLYNVALSDEQIRALVGQNIAKDPLPAHKAYNVDPNPTLSWTPTPLAADTDGHDLYLGTDADLVANRDASVHVSLLDTNSYSPELRLSTTYYWVVDEVNDSEPGSPWAGEVWQFTVRSTTEGYYKDLFIDGGAGLTGYKASDIPAVGQIGYTNEHVTSNNVTVTRKIMVKANAGDWIDDNGVLLYPDNEPRFRMIYVNGGSSGEHRTNLEPEGTGIMQNFVHNGGCYTASCAGAWLSGEKSFRWGLAPLALSTTSTGSTLTDGVFPDGVTSYRGRILPLSPLVAYNPELFGDFKVHAIRQNGGCRCNVGTTGWEEGKSEALLLFDMTWTLYTADPNAVPMDLTIYGSDTQKATHHQCMVWGEKESPEHGKLVPCGSHPEHQQTYGEETPLQAAIYQYAFSFNGRATVKAALTSGVARQMNDNTIAGHEKIGDKQYHHFTIEVPQGATQLQIVLDGNLYDMNLYAKNGDFAFMGERNVVAATNGTGSDETLTINNPSAGTWYIGVKCNKAVAASVNGATYSYTSRFELLNGLAYTITATVQ